MADPIDEAIAAAEAASQFNDHTTYPLQVSCSGRVAALVLPANLTDEEAIELAVTLLMRLRLVTRLPSSPIVTARSLPT